MAVKIQYPGAGPALLSDLNQLARLGRMFAIVSPGLDINPLLRELKARVAEELDYQLEATSQQAFAKAFLRRPRHPGGAGRRLHRPRVLVSEWIDGTPLSVIIREGSQEQRDRAGLLLIRFMFSGPGQGPPAARRPAPRQLPADGATVGSA